MRRGLAAQRRTAGWPAAKVSRPTPIRGVLSRLVKPQTETRIPRPMGRAVRADIAWMLS
jgi:hypothetical protein